VCSSDLLHAKRDELLDIATLNGGNTRSDAKFDVDGAIGTLTFYAELGASLGDGRWLLDGPTVSLGRSSKVTAQHVRNLSRVVSRWSDACAPGLGASSQLASALLAGDVDIVTDLPTQDVAKLRSNQNLFVLDGPEVRTIFIALDTRSDELKHGQKGPNPFKDARVRQALSMAIDRQAIQRTIMRNLSIPAAIMVAPGVNGHTAELDKVAPANIDGAKKLLAEAGHPNGIEFTLDCPNTRYVNDEEVCQAVVGMWAKLGVRAKLNAMPFGPFAQKFQNWDSSAYLLGWGVATYDAQYTLQSLIRTRTKGADGNFNFSGVSNARVDELVDAMGVETDKAKRDGMIREALTITRDQALLVPLHHQMRPWAMKKNVSIAHNSNDAPKMYYANIK
jgi:peptide/nickel transport system substrate-binding protein